MLVLWSGEARMDATRTAVSEWALWRLSKTSKFSTDKRSTESLSDIESTLSASHQITCLGSNTEVSIWWVILYCTKQISWHMCMFVCAHMCKGVCVCDISTQQKIEETRSPAPKTHWPWATTTVAWVLIGGRPRHVVHNTRSHCMSQPLRWLSAIRRNFKLLTFKLDLICQPLTNNW